MKLLDHDLFDISARCLKGLDLHEICWIQCVEGRIKQMQSANVPRGATVTYGSAVWQHDNIKRELCKKQK